MYIKIRHFCQVLKKYSSVSSEVNHAVLDTIETGLVSYWLHEKKSAEGTSARSSFVRHRKLPSQSMPIHVKHFVMPLSLCGMVWISAFVALMRERNLYVQCIYVHCTYLRRTGLEKLWSNVSCTDFCASCHVESSFTEINK